MGIIIFGGVFVMSGFLTIEDVNGVLYDNLNFNAYHCIDTALLNTDNELVNTKYDFVLINYNGESEFVFKIVNSAWTGYFYVIDKNGNYITQDNLNYTYNRSNNTLSIIEEAGFKLYLYCTGFISQTFYTAMYCKYKIFFEDIPLKRVLNDNSNYNIRGLNLQTGEIETININFSSFISGGKLFDTDGYYQVVYPLRLDVPFELENTHLIYGRVNKLTWNVPDYLVNLDIKFELNYNGKSIVFNVSDDYVELDLTDYTHSRLKFSINVLESLSVNNNVFDYDLKVDYVRVSDFDTLRDELLEGTDVIVLESDFVIYDDLYIIDDVLLRGDGYSLDLNGFGFNLKEDVTVKVENIKFNNANPLFLQSPNTRLIINNSTFTNCKNSNYNDLGSVICCIIDSESLNASNDFKTEINNSTFINNTNSILHGGLLNINNCKVHNTDNTIINPNNSNFLYQIDGECNIINSIFDINYSEAFEYNLLFSQSLFMIGENAIINNTRVTDLKENKINFFNNSYNNLSHIYAEYYYPSIDDEVIISPIPSKEDKSICYSISGLDWIFKENAQITRKIWESENKLNKINWED